MSFSSGSSRCAHACALVVLLSMSMSVCVIQATDSSPCLVYFQADSAGNDIEQFLEVNTASECGTHCYASPECVAFVYFTATSPGRKKECFIKSAVNPGGPKYYGTPGMLLVYTGGSDCASRVLAPGF